MTSAVSPVINPSASAAGGRPNRKTWAGVTGLVLVDEVSVQLGAAVAVLLFPRTGAAGVVLMRIGIAAVVLLAVCRPRLRGYSQADWVLIAGFGFVLAAMNSMFYQAIDRIPLGLAVTLEVLGPLVLSVIAARRASSWLWALLALAGVILLGHGSLHHLDLAGMGFALGAAVMWACYILLNARTGQRFPKADGLALAMGFATVLTLPLGLATAGTALLNPVILGLGTAVAALSSVLPYTLEVVVLRRMPTSVFAILMSLGPAIAAAAGWLVLHQALDAAEALAIVLIIAASIGAVVFAPARARSTAKGCT